MLRVPRIGMFFGPSIDPFWVQVLEAIYQKAHVLGLNLIAIDSDLPLIPSGEEETALYEEILAQDLDVLIGWGFPSDLARRVLASGVPIVYLNETDVRHPLAVSPRGLYEIARLIGAFLVEKLNGRGNVLAVGGLMMPSHDDDGRSRVAGFYNALGHYPDIRFRHIPTRWIYDEVYQQVSAGMQQMDRTPDAIFGLSDSIALAARDAGHALGKVDAHTLIVGVNGDPLALAAITEGRLTATVETSTEDLGHQAAEMAYRIARGQPVPANFSYKSRLVTAQNVSEVAAQKLFAIASLPNRLVGFNRQQQQERLVQLETSLEINRRVGSILDSRQLSREIANLIRANYGYDRVYFYRWQEQDRHFELDAADHDQSYPASIPLEQAGILAQAIVNNEPLFIPDARRSARFSLDPDWPDTRSRVVIPVRFSDTIVGVLDLHSHHSTQHTRRELIGLQALANQLGIGIRNAELYSEAVLARSAAERADLLKTRLLANVSHELRTPLDIIIHYSQVSAPAAEASERQHIYRSAEHLKRLINDLLDLSRAEVNELDLASELLDPCALLEDVFSSIADQPGDASTGSGQALRAVAWRLEIPSRLPAVHADPVRLRQILLNLLSNARKFTERGAIVLGAEVAPPFLHIWVRDTGIGIPADLQERIFEPFAALEQTKRRGEGIGLGLSITRRLVALHHGLMMLESQPGQGSTFHVRLPLPALDSRQAAAGAVGQAALLWISKHARPTAEIATIAERQGLALRRLQSGADLHAALADLQVAAIAWDIPGSGAEELALAQSLRAHPHLSSLPLILYGASGAAPEYALGVTSFVVKPVSGQMLQEIISAMSLPQGNGSILIVDDDAHALALHQSIAAQALPGCSVRTAAHGAEAIVMIREAAPAMVVLDLTMPEMDGFEVLDWMRANPPTRRVPVLVLSGRTLTKEDLRRLEQHARVVYQSKDILSKSETAMALHQIMSGDGLAQPTSALVKRTVVYLQQYYDRPLARREIAQAIGVTESYLSRIFRQELALSPWEYLARYRIRQAKQLLLASNTSIADIAVKVGFDDTAYFARVFHKYAGCSPSMYRKYAERVS